MKVPSNLVILLSFCNEIILGPYLPRLHSNLPYYKSILVTRTLVVKTKFWAPRAVLPPGETVVIEVMWLSEVLLYN